MVRGGIERDNAEIKRIDLGNLNGKAIQSMGRTRVGFLAALTIAAQSTYRVEDNIHRYGSLEQMPYTPRLAASRERARRIRHYLTRKAPIKRRVVPR